MADVFRRNLSSGKEIGAAVAVYRDGRKVVDLWGGFRNGITQAPWEQDTLALVFSTTKGVASLAVAVAVSRGLLSYDAKVADYWPEFAQAGKEAITVRQLLSHQAGLPVLTPPLTRHDLANPTRMSAKLEAQRPAWSPGDETGLPRHHAGLVHRGIDPPNRPCGAIIRPVLRRRGRQAARFGFLHRPARLGGPRPRGEITPILRRRCCCTSMRCRQASLPHHSTRSA